MGVCLFSPKKYYARTHSHRLLRHTYTCRPCFWETWCSELTLRSQKKGFDNDVMHGMCAYGDQGTTLLMGRVAADNSLTSHSRATWVVNVLCNSHWRTTHWHWLVASRHWRWVVVSRATHWQLRFCCGCYMIGQRLMTMPVRPMTMSVLLQVPKHLNLKLIGATP